MAANPFESGTRKAIPAVLIYARDPQGRVLMLHRISRDASGAPTERAGDYHAGKWNGLGGKAELDESPQETARREFAEEAGVELGLERFRALGSLTFPNFKAHKSEDWIVWVFDLDLTEAEASDILKRGAEGELHWIPAGELLALNLWPGDRHFIPHVVDRRPFVGTIWYDGPRVTRHWVQPV